MNSCFAHGSFKGASCSRCEKEYETGDFHLGVDLAAPGSERTVTQEVSPTGERSDIDPGNILERSPEPLDFGDYCYIEQERYGVPNEMYLHKVIGRLESNAWVDVPVTWSCAENLHDHMAVVLRCICCGIQEIEVRKYRESDCRPALRRTPESAE